jgi:HK97 family phage major capsid protein
MITKEQLDELTAKVESYKAQDVEVTALKAEIEALKGAETIEKADFNALQEQVNQLKEVGKNENKAESMLETIKANREKINGATREKGNGQVFEMTVKADTLRASVANNPYALDLNDIGQLATRRLTVYDLFPKLSVPMNANGVVRYVDWDEATKVRAAAAVAEGAVIPESTVKFATYTLNLQKVGVTVPVSEEFAYDDNLLMQEVRNFLLGDVALKIDTDLISGNGTAPNIKGLNASATAYTAVASGITDASIYDLIVDMKRSITVGGGSKYAPDFILMNIVDINKMLLKKDVNKQYVAPPFAQGGNGVSELIISGVRVIECNSVTANTAILGDSRYARIYEEAGFVVGMGYDGADWSSDMMTLKARKRLNLLVRTADATGFAKVASISAALTTLAT